MEKFLSWPLFDRLVEKYWNEETGWTMVRRWAAKDLADLEIFANTELQRRAAAREGAAIHVRGNKTDH